MDSDFQRGRLDEWGLGGNQPGLFQGRVGAVFVQRLHRAGGDFDPHILAELRNPDAMLLQVWSEGARHVFRDVTTDAALLLRHTATMNNAAARDFRSCDIANF